MAIFRDLLARLDQDKIIILDGATGTELQRRGVPMHGFAWSAAALDTHPETVRALHEDYIRAGADVIITNSFSTARHVLEPAGLGDRVRALNQRAVSLAQAARENAASGRPVAIAGSISSFRADGTPAEELEANYRSTVGRDGRPDNRRLLRHRARVHPAAEGAAAVVSTADR